MRKTITVVTICALLIVMTPALFAQSSGAHFQKNSVNAVILGNGDLLVSFVEAGLGNYNVDYTLTGNVSAVYFCRTNSGSIPNAANKTTVNATASANGSFEPKNGKVTASLTLIAPAAPVSDPPTCGTGQSLDLQSITWSNVVLTDTTNNVSTAVTVGTFSRTFFPAP